MISIIGAGPAGCYAGYLLAKAGKEVNMFEEHSEIGKPVQCTGIVTSEISRILKIKKDCIINKIENVRIYAPNNNYVDLKLKEKDLILDRSKFDKYLGSLAEESGAKINLSSRFVGYNKKNLIIKKEDKIIRVNNQNNVIVGADGPVSKVAQKFGMHSKRRFLFGLQARVNLKNDNAVEFYPHIGQFSWVVPEDEETVRIGVASYANIKENFDNFLGLKKVDNKKILETQSGLIPIYDSKARIQKNNVFLVGDAATQVKSTTGGGIIPGLIAAECLADSIIKCKDYTQECKNKLSMSLWMHLNLRNMMDKFKNEDWDDLINVFSKKRNTNIIESINRDNISKILLKLLFNEPRLLYFLKYIL